MGPRCRAAPFPTTAGALRCAPRCYSKQAAERARNVAGVVRPPSSSGCTVSGTDPPHSGATLTPLPTRLRCARLTACGVLSPPVWARAGNGSGSGCMISRVHAPCALASLHCAPQRTAAVCAPRVSAAAVRCTASRRRAVASAAHGRGVCMAASRDAASAAAPAGVAPPPPAAVTIRRARPADGPRLGALVNGSYRGVRFRCSPAVAACALTRRPHPRRTGTGRTRRGWWWARA